MISVSSDTISLEEIRESQTRRYLIFGNYIVAIFRLSNDEFTQLQHEKLVSHERIRDGIMGEGGKVDAQNVPVTPYR